MHGLAYLLAPAKRPAWSRVDRWLGEEKFREELLTQMSERMGTEHYGEERAETAEALAERIIAEELKLVRWQEADLKTRPKGDSWRGLWRRAGGWRRR
jgi:hypothetical protein